MVKYLSRLLKALIERFSRDIRIKDNDPPGMARTGMAPDPYYRGAVLVNKGRYFGHNGKSVACAIHHVTEEWICIVEFYEGSDLYAIPFEYLEKIEINRIN
jgi:hypothetical protein